MQNFTLYNGRNLVEIPLKNELKNIIKSCSNKENLFLLNSTNDLYKCSINTENQLENVEHIQSDIVDVECSKDILYIVHENGSVYKKHLDELETSDWTDLPIPNPIVCSHGYRSSQEKVPISQINCNEDGILFVTQKRELYAMGNFGDVAQSIDVPIPVECFSGFKIIQVSMGEHFVVVLTHRKNRSVFTYVDDKSEESTDSAVMLSADCPKCAPQLNKSLEKIERNSDNTSPTSSNSSTKSDLFETESRASVDRSESGISMQFSHKENDFNFLLESFSLSGQSVSKKSKINNGNLSKIKSLVNDDMHNNSQQFTLSNDDGSDEQDCSETASRSYKVTEQSEGLESFCEDLSTDIASAIVDIPVECTVESNMEKICTVGANVLSTCVWCFGSVNNGQLGTGDHVKRTRVNSVLGLTGQGVVKISSGKEHSIALTLDGRLYLWGSNSKQQINSTSKIQDLSSPRRFQSAPLTLDTICGSYSTYILSNEFKLTELSKVESTEEKTPKSFNAAASSVETVTKKCPILLASDNYYIQNHIRNANKFNRFVSVEQKILQDLLHTQHTVIKPFLKKIYLIKQMKNEPFDKLCQSYQNILNIVAANVMTMLNYFIGSNDSYLDLLAIKSSLELTAAYRAYLICFCNVACIQGFVTINLMLNKDKDRRDIFLRPLSSIMNAIELINCLIDSNVENKKFLEAKRSEWERLKCAKDMIIEQTDRTIKFWETNGKNLVEKLQTAERRMILDSKETPIKLLSSGRFSSHWFVLFNDKFCHFSNASTNFYSLNTVWINSLADNDTRKNSFKIVTPEDIFVLVAINHETKLKWCESVEMYIKQSINKTNSVKIPQCRNGTYTFSEKHQKYPRARYFGRWHNGQMHGIGHLEMIDGRVFNGQMAYGEINGFGRMYTPGIGIYEGDFICGKFHGYGVLEMDNHGTYEGNFKDGKLHGHGTLQTNTYTYIGDFKNGLKNGYGVMDNEQSGEKYLGIFVDDRKCGYGITIALDGKYFQGNYAGDTLCGDGVTVLTNGSYYEGDITFNGPHGKGSLFLPIAEVHTEVTELDARNIEMTGNILTGNLNGNWDDIKISNGTLAMGQSFPKLPRSIGLWQVELSKKWHSLFLDWETDVFGSTQVTDCKHIWNRIAIFITNSKRKQNLKSDNFCEKTQESLKSDGLSSQYKNHGQSGSLNSKISQLINDTNNSGDCSSMNNDFMYDNLKNEANLLEIFKSKKGVSDKINKSSTFDYDEKRSRKSIIDNLDFIPDFGIEKLDKEDGILIKDYLAKAFKDSDHPLGLLNSRISYCFYTSYGCWKVRPNSILATQAMKEWEEISKRIYNIVRKMFPALPLDSGICDGEIITHRSLLYPVLLSEGVYSTLFVLYASKCCQNDELYRQRAIACDKKSDEELASFLKMNSDLLPLIKSSHFENILSCFKQVKEKYCPREMLNQIENTFKLITEAKNDILGNFNVLNADNIMPLTIFLILRAGIPHLGAEILLLEDLMGIDFESVMLGFAGYCFATIKATYQHILSDKFSQD